MLIKKFIILYISILFLVTAIGNTYGQYNTENTNDSTIKPVKQIENNLYKPSGFFKLYCSDGSLSIDSFPEFYTWRLPQLFIMINIRLTGGHVTFNSMEGSSCDITLFFASLRVTRWDIGLHPQVNMQGLSLFEIVDID